MNINENPKLIILLSGKRKCGKDYIVKKLLESLPKEHCTIIRISEPIKSHFAKEFNLNLNELMSEGPYKEKYRLDMICWSEKEREKDYGCFCRTACKNASSTNVWIVSDIRRKTDLKWFFENYGDKVKTVRICASLPVRKERGFVFTKGVDDVPSECDLDELNNTDFYLYAENNDPDNAKQIIEKLTKLAI